MGAFAHVIPYHPIKFHCNSIKQISAHAHALVLRLFPAFSARRLDGSLTFSRHIIIIILIIIILIAKPHHRHFRMQSTWAGNVIIITIIKLRLHVQRGEMVFLCFMLYVSL